MDGLAGCDPPGSFLNGQMKFSATVLAVKLSEIKPSPKVPCWRIFALSANLPRTESEKSQRVSDDSTPMGTCFRRIVAIFSGHWERC
jgi:hypothetical protein